jgi:hypothetical protein
MLYYLNTVFLNQGSAVCHEEFHDKLWNKYTYILKYRAKCEISFEILREFLTGNGQYSLRYQQPICVCVRACVRPVVVLMGRDS